MASRPTADRPAAGLNAPLGGTVPSLVTGTLALADGGVWTGGVIQVGTIGPPQNGFGLGGTVIPGLILVAASTADAPTTLDATSITLGSDGENIDAATPNSTGTLDATGGSVIETGTLSLVDGSTVSVDPAGSVVVGNGTAEAGALVVGADGTLAGPSGLVQGNLRLDGSLAEAPYLFFVGDGGTRFEIAGSLTGTGEISAGDVLAGALLTAGVTMEIGDAGQFAGTIALASGQVLVLDHGDARNATLAMTNATVDLANLPDTIAEFFYDSGSGLLVVGGDTLHVGIGLSSGDFHTQSDNAGGTDIICERAPVWQASGGNLSGDWGDTAHWSNGDEPLASDTLAIGVGLAATTSWVVTATDRVATLLTLDLGLGTLAVGGGLSLEGGLVLNSGLLLGDAAAIIGTPEYTQGGGTLSVAAGQMFTSNASLTGSAQAFLTDGGAWTASELSLGDDANGAGDTLDVAAATLTVQDTLALGTYPISPTIEAVGALALTDGATARAGFVTLDAGSFIIVDATSSLTVGSAGTAGAGQVLVTGTLAAAGAAAITGNVVDDGSILLGQSLLGTAAGGDIDGTLTGTGTMEVASQALIGAAAGFLGTLRIDGGDLLTLTDGAAPAGTVAFDVTGTAPQATLDLRGIAWNGSAATYDAATGSLTAGAATLDVGTGLGAMTFSATADSAGGTEIVAVACFAAGTRIATPDGDVAVEALRVGDRVRGPWGEAMPVVWLGHRRVDCRRHPRPIDVWPVRVRAHAFRPGMPARDLLLSPDHAIFLAPPGMRPVLVPVRCLIDGGAVRQETVAAITYWHVELPRHAVLLAEGLPCESFLDTGNRAAFAQGGPALALHPDFAAARWAAAACAPQVRGGPVVEWARACLASRARAQGERAPRRVRSR